MDEKEQLIIQKIPAKTLEWGKTADNKMNWEDAKNWCKKQGEGWRLPTRIELLQALEGKVSGFKDGYYWSSAEYSVTCAWFQHFTTGYQFNTNKIDSHYVRCVRGL